VGKAEILLGEDENIVALELQVRLNSLGYAVTAVAATGEDPSKRWSFRVRR
jgi:hypothetical protein